MSQRQADTQNTKSNTSYNGCFRPVVEYHWPSVQPGGRSARFSHPVRLCPLCVPAYLWIALIALLGVGLLCCTTCLVSLVSCSTHIVWCVLSSVTFVPTVCIRLWVPALLCFDRMNVVWSSSHLFPPRKSLFGMALFQSDNPCGIVSAISFF